MSAHASRLRGLLRELARSDTATSVRQEHQTTRLPPVDATSAWSSAGSAGRTRRSFSHGPTLAVTAQSGRHAFHPPRSFLASSPLKELEFERLHDGGNAATPSKFTLSSFSASGAVDFQDLSLMDTKGLYGADERQAHLTEIYELRKRCAELSQTVEHLQTLCVGSRSSRFTAISQTRQAHFRTTHRGYACLASALQAWRCVVATQRDASKRTAHRLQQAVILVACQAKTLRDFTFCGWALAAKHARKARADPRARAFRGSHFLLTAAARETQHVILTAWRSAIEAKRSLGLLQAQVYEEQAIRYGLVQAEQRKCQASLVETEARYREELQNLRAELADVEARCQQQQQDELQVRQPMLGASDADEQPEREARQEMARLSRLIALAEVVAESAELIPQSSQQQYEESHEEGVYTPRSDSEPY